jgi:hypothetical protein
MNLKLIKRREEKEEINDRSYKTYNTKRKSI